MKSLKEIEIEHIGKVLEHTNHNRVEAARILGVSVDTIKRRLRSNPKLAKEYPSTMHTINKDVAKYLFEIGIGLGEIANKLNCSYASIQQSLAKRYSETEYKKILNNNKGITMNTDEIIENNRKIAGSIAEKIRDNEEMTEEELVYAKIMFNNGLMLKDGTMTKEGIETLYN